MIPGFNHNVRYKEKSFHVQTEDSGPAVPVITTHIFLGGNIVASRKTMYGELIKRGENEDAVRKLMQEQHKTIMHELFNGKFDSTISKLADVTPSGIFPAVETGSKEKDRPKAKSEVAISVAPDHSSSKKPPLPGHDAGAGAGLTVNPHTSPTRPGAGLQPGKEQRPSTNGKPKIFGADILTERSFDQVVIDFITSRENTSGKEQ
ncbi:MAG: hypothetical protein GXP49_00470 [Deltaproteobacteria bacterium]|nr:hypothetical protein [Deltaproteobacteria bacterium]